MNGSQDSVQSIFITGAASGIGRETAPALRAVHGRQVHWVPGAFLKSMRFFSGLMPFASKATMKMLDRRK
jgi:hypothetical protein